MFVSNTVQKYVPGVSIATLPSPRFDQVLVREGYGSLRTQTAPCESSSGDSQPGSNSGLGETDGWTTGLSTIVTALSGVTTHTRINCAT